jgi:hypothetical protein
MWKVQYITELSDDRYHTATTKATALLMAQRYVLDAKGRTCVVKDRQGRRRFYYGSDPITGRISWLKY